MDTATAVIFTNVPVRHNDCSTTPRSQSWSTCSYLIKYQRLPTCKDKVQCETILATTSQSKLLSTSSSTEAENKRRLLSRPDVWDSTDARAQSGFTSRLCPRFRAPDPALICAFHDFASQSAGHAHAHDHFQKARGAVVLCFRRDAPRISDRVPIAPLFDFAGSAACPVKAATVICAQSSLLALLTSSQNIAPTPHPQPPTSVD